MKLVMLLLMIVPMHICHAANVHWATLTIEDRGDGNPYCVFDNYGVVNFYVGVTHDAIAQSFTLSFRFDEYLYGIYENILPAREGDVVSSATTRQLDDNQYVVHYGIDDDRYFFGEITGVVPNSDIYLSYICTYESSWYGENRYYYYGWVDIYLDSDGQVNAWGAFDKDGGPMIVGGGAWEGGIPEPSGGMLLLIGTAVLGLRRRTIRPIML